LQTRQGAGSSLARGHGQRERDPRDPSAFNYDVHGMEYLVGQYWVTCPVRPSLQVRPFPTPHLGDLRGLSVISAAIVIIIHRSLFLHSFPTISSV